MKTTVLLLGLILCLASCQEKDEASYFPGRKGPLVASVTKSKLGVDGYTVTSYSYDNAGRIVALKKESIFQSIITTTTQHRLKYTGGRVDIESQTTTLDKNEWSEQHTTVWLNKQGRLVSGEYKFTRSGLLGTVPYYATMSGNGQIQTRYNTSGQLDTFGDGSNSQLSYKDMEAEPLKFSQHTAFAYQWASESPSLYQYSRTSPDMEDMSLALACQAKPDFTTYRNTTNTDFIAMEDNLYQELGLLGDLCPCIPEQMYYEGSPSNKLNITFSIAVNDPGWIVEITRKLGPDDTMPTVWEFTYF